MDHADFTPNSSYGVLRPHWSKRPHYRIDTTEDHDAELIVRGAFAPWADHYRQTLPKMYAQVDVLLAKPDRVPRSVPLVKFYTGAVQECPRCGDPFPVRGKRPPRFCSPECHDEHLEFCKRTGRPFREKKAA